MSQPLHLLMTETSPELCHQCKSTLPAQDIEVTVCPRNGPEAYSELIRLKPDAMLMDVFMPGFDAFTLKKSYDEAVPEGKTRLYVTGTFQNEGIEQEVMESGFGFYFLKPLYVQNLAARLLWDAEKPTHREPEYKPSSISTATFEEEGAVIDMLRTIGVPAHIRGYHFLRDAILMVIENPNVINSITKVLYPNIALEHHTTPYRVERSMRHAIEVAWDRGDIEVLSYYFGSTVHARRGKPTNSEFIAMLADRILMKQRHRIH